MVTHSASAVLIKLKHCVAALDELGQHVAAVHVANAVDILSRELCASKQYSEDSEQEAIR